MNIRTIVSPRRGLPAACLLGVTLSLAACDRGAPAAHDREASGTAARTPARNRSPEFERAVYGVGALAAQTAIGYGLGKEDLDLLVKGFSDTLTGKTSHRALNPHFAAIRPALDARRERHLAEVRAEHRAHYQRIKDAGTHREIAPGVLFASIAEGKGDPPTAGQQVTIRFKETLYGLETPLTKDETGETKSFTVPLGSVIPCWREALTRMKPAGRARLVCHDGAAFGPGGRPPFVPGGATMLYELELLSVANAPPVPSASHGHDGHAFLKELASKGQQ